MKHRKIKKIKKFTLEEANRALILIRPIAKDIRKIIAEISKIEMKDLQEDSQISSEMLEFFQINHLKLIHYLNELQNIGVYVTDIVNVVVDFPATHNNKDIYFCWKWNEPEVHFFHETHCESHARKYIYSTSPKHS